MATMLAIHFKWISFIDLLKVFLVWIIIETLVIDHWHISNSMSGFVVASPERITKYSFHTITQQDSSPTIVSNNSSSSNDSQICHPILLSQGFKSYLGLCDDYFTSYIVMGSILSCHSILLLITLSGLFYKLRKLKQVEQFNHVNFINARNPVLMICGAVVGWLYTLIMSSRVLIGRKIFPCMIFSLIYYLSVPGLASTIIIRCARLIAMTKLYELKVRIGKREMLQEKEEGKISTILITSNNKEVKKVENEGNNNIQIVIKMAESFENMPPRPICQPLSNDLQQNSTELSNITTTTAVTTSIETNSQEETESVSTREHNSFHNELPTTTAMIMQQQNSTIRSCETATSVSTPSSTVLNSPNILGEMSVSPSIGGTFSSTNGFLRQVQSDETYHQSIVVDITKLHELDLNTRQDEQAEEEFYGNEYKHIKMDGSFENGKLLKLLRFLTGSKFILMFYILILGTHTLSYLTVGIIDYCNYNNSDTKLTTTTNKKNAFVVDTYLFSPSGCGTGSYNTNYFLGMLSVYASISVILAIVALIVMKKDVWQVKREVVLVAINWILCIAVFGIPNMFVGITTL